MEDMRPSWESSRILISFVWDRIACMLRFAYSFYMSVDLLQHELLVTFHIAFDFGNEQHSQINQSLQTALSAIWIILLFTNHQGMGHFIEIFWYLPYKTRPNKLMFTRQERSYIWLQKKCIFYIRSQTAHTRHNSRIFLVRIFFSHM